MTAQFNNPNDVRGTLQRKSKNHLKNIHLIIILRCIPAVYRGSCGHLTTPIKLIYILAHADLLSSMCMISSLSVNVGYSIYGKTDQQF